MPRIVSQSAPVLSVLFITILTFAPVAQFPQAQPFATLPVLA